MVDRASRINIACLILIVLVLHARLPDDFLDPSGDLFHNLLFGLLLLGFLFGDPSWRGGQVELIYASQHESWKEVGVFTVVSAVLGIEPISNWEETEDFDIVWQCLINLESQIFQMFFQVARLPLFSTIFILDHLAWPFGCQKLGTEYVDQSVHFFVRAGGSAPTDLLEIVFVEVRDHSNSVERLGHFFLHCAHAFVFLRAAEVNTVVASQYGDPGLLGQEWLAISVALGLFLLLCSSRLLSTRSTVTILLFLSLSSVLCLFSFNSRFQRLWPIFSQSLHRHFFF